MRLLIASDLHGSLNSLNFLESRIQELMPDMLILLGDLVYHGPRNPLPPDYDTLGILRAMPGLTAMRLPIIAVRGNCDAEVDMTHLPFPMPENAWIDEDGLRIFACHGHHLPEVPPIPGFPASTVILRGHTHVPRGESLGSLHFWNPGSLSLPKQGFPRSYGFYESGVFRVFDLEGNEILRHEPGARIAATNCNHH